VAFAGAPERETDLTVSAGIVSTIHLGVFNDTLAVIIHKTTLTDKFQHQFIKQELKRNVVPVLN
jgi:hypothetical protein